MAITASICQNGQPYDNVRLEKYVFTMDDFCPNFFENYVQVSFFHLYPSGLWRVAIWGNDDLGFDRDFTDRAQAELCYVALINEPYISRYSLVDVRGFNYF